MSYEYMERGEDIEVGTEMEAHELANLLPMMTDETYAGFLDSVRAYGILEPIIILEGKILDGRNRYKACVELGIPCPTNHVTDVSPNDIVTMLNINRRHLNPSQIALFYQGVMERQERLAKQRQSLKVNLPEVGQASDIVAKAAGVSGKTMRDAKVVKQQGTKEEVEAVVQGIAAVSSTATAIRERAKTNNKQMNSTNDNIGWAQYSWNPVVGCKFGCEFCYAAEIHERYFKDKHAFTDPILHEDRLEMPANTKLKHSDRNNRVFVCSMAELFGDWVPQAWIDQVLTVCHENPQWLFVFLTKNPKRLPSIHFPLNAWVGATIHLQEREKAVADAFAKMPAVTKFVSCEPLLEPVVLSDKLLKNLDLIIIGALSKGATKEQPKAEWVESLLNQARGSGVSIWFKENLVFRPQELPK